MGGTGSGSWCRWDKKTAIEQTRRIDIRYLRRSGWLSNNPGSYRSGKLSWSCGGEPDGFINATCYHNSLHLDYRYREGGGDWEPVSQTIYFDSTPCHYGGVRQWFLCPRCDRRVAIMCGGGKLFLCRRCYQLPYRSENEGYIDRLISKKHKIGARIFQDYDGDGWRKKKGMHYKTFDRLFQRYIVLNEKIDRLISLHILN